MTERTGNEERGLFWLGQRGGRSGWQPVRMAGTGAATVNLGNGVERGVPRPASAGFVASLGKGGVVAA